MGTKTPNELLADWKLDKMTTEQAIGHILQNLLILEKHHHELDNAIYELIKQRTDLATKHLKNNEILGEGFNERTGNITRLHHRTIVKHQWLHRAWRR